MLISKCPRYSEGFTGKGVATYTNGDVFDGEFVDGKKQGPGKYTHLDGAVYEGAYDADVRSGLGRLTYASGGLCYCYLSDLQCQCYIFLLEK